MSDAYEHIRRIQSELGIGPDSTPEQQASVSQMVDQMHRSLAEQYRPSRARCRRHAAEETP